MTKTSTTGKPIDRGFTLIELIVVMAVIGLILALAAPTTRDALTVDALKKASRQIIGLERQLRVEAVRDQVDCVLVFDIPRASYFVATSEMTPEKRLEVEKQAKKLPDGVSIRDIVSSRNEKKTDGKVRIRFGKNGTSPPLVIHLAEGDKQMTLVVNPFLGVTAVYPRYAEVSVEDGLGREAAR